MSQGNVIAGNQAAARERAIADLRDSARRVGLLALEACPGVATMTFCMRFGHHLSTLAHLARGQQQLRGEQPGSQQPANNQNQPRMTSKPKHPPDNAKPKPPKDHKVTATSGTRSRPLAETLAFL